MIHPKKRLVSIIFLFASILVYSQKSAVYEYGDLDAAFAEAAHVVKIDRLHFHRFSSTPLETNGCVATWDKRGELDFFTTNTFPTIGMQMMAPALGMSIDKIRCRTHDIGGRLSWNIRAPVSKKTKNSDQKRKAMQEVCMNCHNENYVKNH